MEINFPLSQIKKVIFDLKNRFRDFGSYEDAIVNDQVSLNHSLLSP